MQLTTTEGKTATRDEPHLRATSQRHGQDRTPLTEDSAISRAKRQRLTLRTFILRARTPYRRFTRHFKLRPEVVSILVMVLHAPLVLNLHLSQSGLPDELGALTTASLRESFQLWPPHSWSVVVTVCSPLASLEFGVPTRALQSTGLLHPLKALELCKQQQKSPCGQVSTFSEGLLVVPQKLSSESVSKTASLMSTRAARLTGIARHNHRSAKGDISQ